MNWLGFVQESLGGSLKTVWQIAVIVVPIMICLEVAKDLDILDRIARRLAPFIRPLGMSKEGAFPLLVGLIFGLSYGGGVIIDYAKNGELNWQDLFLINVFLIICHSVVEDIALFMAIGANGPVILVCRLVMAVAVTYLLAHSVWLKNKQTAVTVGSHWEKS